MRNDDIDSGYFWVRLKGQDSVQPALFDGDEYWLIGQQHPFKGSSVDAAIRMMPPPDFFKNIPSNEPASG